MWDTVCKKKGMNEQCINIINGLQTNLIHSKRGRMCVFFVSVGLNLCDHMSWDQARCFDVVSTNHGCIRYIYIYIYFGWQLLDLMFVSCTSIHILPLFLPNVITLLTTHNFLCIVHI